ncbi:MAG: hypothetical protein NC225_12035 [Clostridium sp.]|nr:hypothetical protein [Clostridium sp.]MCM1460934.1 hypothetical protein [Bacteroides sp.]
MVFCVITLIIFVMDSQTVIAGATHGLMLWYQNVVPILLPFMLISALIVNSISQKQAANSNSAILSTLFLGILCGYPIGAKVTSDYMNHGIYSKQTGNILLPLCNNSSPMFISGYITNYILGGKISFLTIMALIYIPYVLVSLVFVLLGRLKKSSSNSTTSLKKIKRTQISSGDIIENSITAITCVGVYIMLCSIIIEFINHVSPLPENYNLFLAGMMEITRGTEIFYLNSPLDLKIKTALIIGFTSFGGISALLQTNKVISNSELSVIRYIVIKILCAAMSFLFAMLLI